MKKKIHLILSLSAVLALFLTALPVLSPVVFTSASKTGAIRHEIYKKGYPYQSYFAILHKEEDDNEAGNLYYVNWFDWKDETGQTPQLCYSKKSSEGMYKVSCGTGP
ncbi:hypothetical protein QRX25_14535 [Bacillus sp. L381]|uniref:hypothetical protein n=1 Tax=Bacillus TaxID=1386 RepID=UPI001BA475A1|nr:MULTISPECIES: hypothetical protein [Bacillus]MCR9040879.1 hypothetical protein [Bacillus velezensis]QUN08704.1 hypothetical protein KEF49_14340 [Bacillus amyloliquefaciens]QYM81776.1 hypothetical protein KTJ85_14185 [Bacillus sp. 7D3]QZY10921.1 hypothetical protein K7B13_14435 [Bacillus amyloliquefaciens]WIX20819.1 hypothetical protein QRX25_14535 [Bacillus sp. L381]